MQIDKTYFTGSISSIFVVDIYKVELNIQRHLKPLILPRMLGANVQTQDINIGKHHQVISSQSANGDNTTPLRLLFLTTDRFPASVTIKAFIGIVNGIIEKVIGCGIREN